MPGAMDKELFRAETVKSVIETLEQHQDRPLSDAEAATVVDLSHRLVEAGRAIGHSALEPSEGPDAA